MLVDDGDCVGGLGDKVPRVGDPESVESLLGDWVYEEVTNAEGDGDQLMRVNDAEELEVTLSVSDRMLLAEGVVVHEGEVVGGEAERETDKDRTVGEGSELREAPVGLSDGVPERVASDDSVTELLDDKTCEGECDMDGVSVSNGDGDAETVAPLTVMDVVCDFVSDFECVMDSEDDSSGVADSEMVWERVWLCVLVAPYTRPIRNVVSSALEKK